MESLSVLCEENNIRFVFQQTVCKHLNNVIPTSTRTMTFAPGISFNGYIRELRVYVNFQNENFDNLYYLIFKNYMSVITNPTEYPFLIFYMRWTAP